MRPVVLVACPPILLAIHSINYQISAIPIVFPLRRSSSPGFAPPFRGNLFSNPVLLRPRQLARGVYRVFLMDSEDDMHDANDVESLDDFYSGTTAMDSDDGDGDYEFIDNDSDDSDDSLYRRQQWWSHIERPGSVTVYMSFFVIDNYAILSEQDIQKRQEEDITRISTVLSIPRVSASILLRHYNWSVTKVHDAWFADEEKVRRSVGLLENPVVDPMPNAKELTCGICFETYPRDQMNAAVCGHQFCCSCWTGYISTSINDGPGCLMLRCPDPSCGAAVGQDMINMLASDEDKEKYSRYLLRSYIEDNKTTKWCPAPGCEYAVDFVMGSGSYDVACNSKVGHSLQCTEEAHRPVDCGTVAMWILKNSAESENMNWLCLGAWSDHGERTGGFYACNRYETAKQEGVYDETEKRREMAKNSLERYTHYYERWATNQSSHSRQKALSDLQQMQTVHRSRERRRGHHVVPRVPQQGVRGGYQNVLIGDDVHVSVLTLQLEKLSDKQCQPESQLKFIADAWLQIVECRRVLKWTYAYGYYLPEKEHAKRQFFEYLQGEAESGLERLHQCAEKELQIYLDAEGPSKDFNEFRTKLAGLTRALETGLSDVGSEGSSDVACRMTTSKSMNRKSRGGRGKAGSSKSGSSRGETGY
ncbi:hypothetical protein ACLOJK_009033 [Asimina triloba]